MSLKLYGNLRTRAGRCLWALEELGLPYQLVPLNPHAGQTRTPDYLKLNPLAKVPTLVDGDFVLTESVAINQYLCELADGRLLPSDARGRARVLQWTSWATTELEYPLTVMVRAARAAAPAALDPAVALGCLGDCEATLRALEAHLTANGDWIAGREFSIGDVNTAFSVNFVAGRVAMDRFAHTQAWLARCLARPAWLRVQAIDEAALAKAS